jgi:hypothetical protein
VGRILKTPGSIGAARMMVAEFDGYVRDGVTFKVLGSHTSLRDGDLLAFNYPEGLAAGISISEDAQGLHSIVGFGPSRFLRIGLEPLGGGTYAFRPAAHHMELWPELRAGGAGAQIK